MARAEDRAGRNEALFREVNEEVRELAGSAGRLEDELGIVCECSDGACTERLQVPLGVYEETRAHPERFIVAPGHERAFERIVERAERYVVVAKEGEAAQVAVETDPRA